MFLPAGSRFLERQGHPARASPSRRAAIVKCRPEATQAIMYAGAEANRRGFGKIPGWAADLPNWITESDDLCEYLVIKKEIIRIFFQR